MTCKGKSEGKMGEVNVQVGNRHLLLENMRTEGAYPVGCDLLNGTSASVAFVFCPHVSRPNVLVSSGTIWLALCSFGSQAFTVMYDILVLYPFPSSWYRGWGKLRWPPLTNRRRPPDTV